MTTRGRQVAAACARIGGVLVVVLGLAHNWFGLPDLQRAVARGDVAVRLAEPHLINWAFSGAAMSVLGIVCLLLGGELGAGSRVAWRITLVIGTLFILVGAGAYLRSANPSVLIFVVPGVLLAGPLLISSRAFPAFRR